MRACGNDPTSGHRHPRFTRSHANDEAGQWRGGDGSVPSVKREAWSGIRRMRCASARGRGPTPASDGLLPAGISRARRSGCRITLRAWSWLFRFSAGLLITCAAVTPVTAGEGRAQLSERRDSPAARFVALSNERWRYSSYIAARFSGCFERPYPRVSHPFEEGSQQSIQRPGRIPSGSGPHPGQLLHPGRLGRGHAP